MQIAFHTYFACDDISQVAVCNLGGLNYLDNLDDRKEKAQEDDTVVHCSCQLCSLHETVV